MGASILVHWPGATERDEGGHPGFFNDDKAWAGWLANVLDDNESLELLAQLDASALLSHTTDGMESDEIQWTTPDELERAAATISRLVEQAPSTVDALLRVYQMDANCIDPLPTEFLRDLRDVAAIAKYARDRGASSVTLGYYW